MNFMNSDANIKQFQLLRFINENSSDDHVVSSISIVLRRDKIEAPYYMVSKIKLSSCIDRPENGLVHAMDLLNHHRRYNLDEDKYNEIRSLIVEDSGSDLVKITENENQLKIVLMSRNDEEFNNIFNAYEALFDAIDNLTD
ncbi:MAG: hypothetical protein IJ258_03865 [Methanobrevibacter sp.]|uniref:hypothetical protein n=1 Tax=Methanobrevibacter sp. TaxID=66852 RepID=UPI0025F23239|nr:hypothetical protein [Methanobrevibacter sp.]MBQ8017223.1 hypothetical protein [Methanobrevibacter sp.]